MSVVETKIKGCFVIEPERIEDERGYFARAWCRKQFEMRGIVSEFVQCNIAFSKRRGTLRGLHFQSQPHQEAKLIRCISGSIYDVIIDLDPDSPSYKQWVGVELTADVPKMLYVRENCAQGFITLEDNTEIEYQVSEFYSPECERGVRYDDPAFCVKWPTDVRVISEKDKSWPDYSVWNGGLSDMDRRFGVGRR